MEQTQTDRKTDRLKQIAKDKKGRGMDGIVNTCLIAFFFLYFILLNTMCMMCRIYIPIILFFLPLYSSLFLMTCILHKILAQYYPNFILASFNNCLWNAKRIEYFSDEY
ncbi:hypothetical protein EGW08_015244 [Elysia chlorotica]|uniref:Uncharacterized protein n=1 Tax=Elysia chlorotica TaxID=188477 RepID=A0A3S1B7L0_ELYCH|nr:hypothetical protein EGW08_015244 [Elysia chlorotica]